MKIEFKTLYDYETAEVDLTNACNLKCILCYRTLFPSVLKNYKSCLSFEKWIEIFDRYKRLKKIVIAGVMSEPTLYPNIMQLIDYFVKRNISIDLYSNGNTHDEKWWNNLNKHLTSEDRVIFTICGSTQELHEKYRVGSNLQQILDHAKAFRGNNQNRNLWALVIKFRYNFFDIQNNISNILNFFDCVEYDDTHPRYHFFFKKNKELYKEFDICSDKSSFIDLSLLKINDINKNFIKHKVNEYRCTSLLNNYIYIDSNGFQFPCKKYFLSKNIDFSNTKDDDMTIYMKFIKDNNFCFFQKDFYVKNLKIDQLKQQYHIESHSFE